MGLPWLLKLLCILDKNDAYTQNRKQKWYLPCTFMERQRGIDTDLESGP